MTTTKQSENINMTTTKQYENITIAIVGFPNAGKSTITNSLTCNNYSKKNTECETIFKMGDYDDKTYNDDEITALLLNQECINIKMPDNYYLDNKYSYTFVDIVGVERESNIQLDLSMKRIKKSKILFDLFVVVFDINKLEEDSVKNKKLLNNIKKISEENYSAKIIIILNKCDSLVCGKVSKIMSSTESSMIEMAHDQFKEFNCEILPLCAIKSHMFSAGIRGKFGNDTVRNSYTAEIEYADPQDLLRKHGFISFTNKIRDYVELNKYDIINNHISYDLTGDIFHVDELLIFIRRMRTNVQVNKGVINDEMLQQFEEKTLNFMHKNITLENVDMFIDKFNKIKKMYERDFVKTFDTSNNFDTKMKQIYTEKIIHELNTEFKRLYDIGELQPALVYETMCKHTQTIDIGCILHIISQVTNHDPDFMFSVIHAYVTNDTMLYLPFKHTNIEDPYLNFIKIKLSQETFETPLVNFNELFRVSNIFKKISQVFNELCPVNYTINVENYLD